MSNFCCQLLQDTHNNYDVAELRKILVVFLNLLKRSESLSDAVSHATNRGKMCRFDPPEDLTIIENTSEMKATFDKILHLIDEEHAESSWAIFAELNQ